MYKGGKLTAAARAKLQKRYAKERAKDSILAKIDSQGKRRPKKKQIKTENKIAKQTETKPVEQVESKKVVKVEAADQFELESECPSTPPRNDMVNERNQIMKQNAGVNWISFVEHVQKESKATKELARSLEIRSQQEFKKSLEEQCQLREEIREKERQQVKREQEKEQEIYKRYDDEEAKKAAIRHAKVEELKKMRQEQIQLLNKARRQYAKKELRRDQRACKKAQEEREAHEQKLLNKKKAHYAMMEEVLKENAEHKKVVEAQMKVDAEEDIRLQKMYAKMLEDQEKAREARLAATYAQTEKKLANLLDCTEEERRIEREANERAERELLERQAAEDEKNRLKNDRRRRENLEVQDYLANQIKMKKEREKKQKEEDLKIGQRLAKEAQASLESEKLKIQKKQEVLLDTAAFIRQQIKDNETRRFQERADMNENEKKFNASLINKIKNNDIGVKEPEHDPQRPFAWRYKCRSKPF